MLNTSQTLLYQRLQDFELDDPTHEFGFTRHLVKNHGWTLVYAQMAIAEYKKFAFLTVVADHQIVPSDAVDQVWHAHVLLTQSYWEEFCPRVLGQKLHHHPARGGPEERTEFHHLYRQTIASYRQFFGAPPTEIWSPPERRFGTELKMRRISLNENWVIPKRLPLKEIYRNRVIYGFLITLVFMIGFAQTSSATSQQQHEARYSLNGLALIILSIILGLLLRYWARRPKRSTHESQLNIYQIAYLAGGQSHTIDLAITQLVKHGYLLPNVRYKTLIITKTPDLTLTTLEQQVLQQLQRTPELYRFRLSAVNRFTQELITLSLSMSEIQLLLSGWRLFIGTSFGLFMAITGFFMLLSYVVAVIKSWGILSVSEANTIFPEIARQLYSSWTIIGVVALCCFIPSTRTHWGDQVLANLKSQDNLDDPLQRFALYGYQSLSGGNLDNLKKIFTDESEENSAGGCGCGC